MPWDEWTEACYECGQVIEGTPMFVIKYENYWLHRYLCSTKCLDDFIVVAEAEALLDEVSNA